MLSIRVLGNALVDEADNIVQLRGVNRMGTEYACVTGGGFGIFAGPSTTADNAATLSAMANSWHINAVRIPLNETCWLDRDSATLDPKNIGAHYRGAIVEWVGQVTGLGMVAIVELHWNAPAGVVSEGQAALPDADNSVDFWASVANTFMDNPLVIFDLHNEPYPDREVPVPADPWMVWLMGGTLHLGNPPAAGQPTFAAVGMQALVDVVRGTGAANPIMLGGLAYANELDGLLDHLPMDPLAQLVASWHVYPDQKCGLGKQPCWEAAMVPILAQMPVVAGEFGRGDCRAGDLDAFMTWMDDHGGSYIAWVWTVTEEPCEKGNRYDLIDDYVTGNPTTPTGATIRNHYLLF